MKKKLFRMLLIGMMSLMLAACGQDNSRNQSDSDREEVMEEKNDEEEAEEEKKEVEEVIKEEEVVEEEPEVITKEYALHGLYGTFHDGVCWAYVIDEEETKKWVLVNTDMQVMYEAPEEAKNIVAINDDFIANGRSVFLTNQGFMVIGTDGTILYEYQDEMEKDTLCVAADGNIMFQKHISNMTQDAYFLCVMDEQFQIFTEIELVERNAFDSPYYGEYDEQYCGGYVEKITDGLYLVANFDNYNFWINYIIDVKNGIIPMGRGAVVWFKNGQDGIGLATYYDERDNHLVYAISDASVLEFGEGDTIHDAILDSSVKESGKCGTYANGVYIFDGDYDSNFSINRMTHPYELTMPDFGVRVTDLIPSQNGSCTGIKLLGEDNEFYYTVLDGSGQQLYEPVKALHDDIGIIINGYIFIPGYGEGITRDGQTFTIGDGTDLSGITEDYAYIMRAYYGYGDLFISEGYISAISESSDQTAVYRLDGTAVTTVTAVE